MIIIIVRDNGTVKTYIEKGVGRGEGGREGGRSFTVQSILLRYSSRSVLAKKIYI